MLRRRACRCRCEMNQIEIELGNHNQRSSLKHELELTRALLEGKLLLVGNALELTPAALSASNAASEDDSDSDSASNNQTKLQKRRPHEQDR